MSCLKARINTTVLTISLVILTTITAHTQEQSNLPKLPDDAFARLGKGHINDMLYTADGMRIVVATSVGIWIYDVQDFTEKYLLKAKQTHAQFLAISPDGNTLVSTGGSGVVHLWDTHTGQHKRKFNTDSHIRLITFSRDGKTLATLGIDDALRLWDTSSWKEKHKIQNAIDFEKRSIFSFAVSQNNLLVATGVRDGRVYIDGAIDGSTKEMSGKHESYVRDVAFSPEEDLLASASNKSIRFWDTETGEQKQVIQVATSYKRIVFSPDGNLLASRANNGEIHLYDVKTGKLFRVLKGHNGSLHKIVFSPDLRTLTSAGTDGTIRIWDVFSGKQIHAFENHFGNFTCFDVSPMVKQSSHQIIIKQSVYGM